MKQDCGCGHVDPLSAALEAAVGRAIVALLPTIVDAIKAALPEEPAAPPPEPADRLVRMAEATRMLGVNRATIWKWEKAGTLPPFRRIGSAVGYLLSDIKKIQQGGA